MCIRDRSNKKELIEIVENLIDLMPVELRTARWLVREQDTYLNKAREEANEILSIAKVESDRLIADSYVLQEAVIEANALIKKAEDGENSNLEEIRYEGYAPGGVALIVDALTDNRNRTAAEVRSSFTKYGGNLGETGSVSFMFNNVGQIVYKKNIMSEDEIFDIAIEVGANDVKAEENNYEIITSVNEFNNVREKLEDILGVPDQAELIWYP